MENVFENGYVIFPTPSPVKGMVPTVRNMWSFCMMEANSEGKFVVPSVVKLREMLSWEEDGKVESFSIGQCRRALKKLCKIGCLSTQKIPGGIEITVTNYKEYQDLPNQIPPRKE